MPRHGSIRYERHAIAATMIYDLIYTSYCFAAAYRSETSLQFAMSQMALT